MHTQTAGTHYTPLVADPSMVLISTVTVLAEGALNTTVNMADMPSLTLYTTGSNSITTSVDERGGGARVQSKTTILINRNALSRNRIANLIISATAIDQRYYSPVQNFTSIINFYDNKLLYYNVH